jgi:hypothetical protein
LYVIFSTGCCVFWTADSLMDELQKFLPYCDLKPGLYSLWPVAKLTTLSRPISKYYAHNKNVLYRWNCNLIVFHLLWF